MGIWAEEGNTQDMYERRLDDTQLYTTKSTAELLFVILLGYIVSRLSVPLNTLLRLIKQQDAIIPSS